MIHIASQSFVALHMNHEKVVYWFFVALLPYSIIFFKPQKNSIFCCKMMKYKKMKMNSSNDRGGQVKRAMKSISESQFKVSLIVIDVFHTLCGFLT